jgi:hypothetical protein
VALGELSGRVLWFFVIHLLLFIALYLLGNAQQFLDQTQLMLLRLMELAAIVAAGTGVYRVGYGLVRVFAGGSPALLRLFATLLATVFSAAMVLASMYLLIWFQL